MSDSDGENIFADDDSPEVSIEVPTPIVEYSSNQTQAGRPGVILVTDSMDERDFNNGNLRDEQPAAWFAPFVEKALTFYGISLPIPFDELISKYLTPQLCLLFMAIAYGMVYTEAAMMGLVLIAQALLTHLGNDTIEHFTPLTFFFMLNIFSAFYEILIYMELITFGELMSAISTDFLAAPPSQPNLAVAFWCVLCRDFAWKHATIVTKLCVQWQFVTLGEQNEWLKIRIQQCIEQMSRLIRTIAPVSVIFGAFPLPANAFGSSVVERWMIMFIDHGLPFTVEGVMNNIETVAGRMFIAYYAKLKILEIVSAFYCAGMSAIVLLGAITRRYRMVSFKKGEECPVCYLQPRRGIQLDCLHRFCANCINRWSESHRTCPLCRQTYETGIVVDGTTLSGGDGHTQLFPRLF